jgi:uncharacterized membrane protein AbrB (regulator of aidB expression)
MGGPRFLSHYAMRNASAERSRQESENDVTKWIERTPQTMATYVRASLLYLGFMTAWVYGFANTERHVPGLVMLVALILPMFLHFGIGFAMPRQETFGLLAFPPLLALVGPGVNAMLWVPLVMMMVFPGAPLVLLGLFLRRRAEPQEVEDYWF